MTPAPCGRVRRVTQPSDPKSRRALDLAQAALSRPGAPPALPDRLLVVDVERQTATWLDAGARRRRVAGVDRAQRHRRRGELVQDAARLAPHPRADRRGRRCPAPCSCRASRPARSGAARQASCDDDLILTRILTLDGLEDGINRGPGHDSLERYIYLHGTNHEDLLGRPVSCGCVRLSNTDICALFDAHARRRPRADRPARDARHPRSEEPAASTMRGSAAPA